MFAPNFKNILDCAYNKKPSRTPLYEHIIDDTIMEKILKTEFVRLRNTDLDGYFAHFCRFFREMGYDTVSFENCVTSILPHGGALAHPQPGYIDSVERFKNYPFETLTDRFIQRFAPVYDALRRQMPDGMMAIGGVGTGIFENVQDLCGFEGLCILKYDEPEVYAGMFEKIGKAIYDIWDWFLTEYSDVFCVVRMGDDLGYKSNTMLSTSDICEHIVPGYQKIIALAHRHKKPFLLHSCGNIFSVMDAIIDAGIDAKHSNEDQIADFEVWIEKYGGKIGNFGGIDTDKLVTCDDEKLAAITANVYKLAQKKNGGLAIGSGNSIPSYVDYKKYLVMVNTIRTLRGDF